METTRPGSNSDIEKPHITPPDSGTASQDNVAPPPRPQSNFRWVLTCLCLYLGAFLYGLDTTIAATVQASVYESFENIEKLPWIGIGFPLGSVAIILFVGKSFGTFEIKGLTIFFITFFEIGSAICGAAPTPDALIIGRVLAGMGGAGMYIGALNYFSIFTSPNRASLYNGLIGLSWGIGAILGPVIGGAFSDSSATWRWAFYINLPLAAFVIPASIFTFPTYNPQPQRKWTTKLKQLDWIGAFLNATTFTLFIVVVTFQGPEWEWASPGAIVMWILFGVSLIAYAIQQVYCIGTTPERRLFPVDFLKSRTLLLTYFTVSASSSAMTVTIYYIPLFFQFTKNDTALEACIRLLPFIFPFIALIMFSGALMPTFGRYKIIHIPAGILILIGGTLMYLVTITTSIGAIYGFTILIAVGVGSIYQLGYAIAAAKVSPARVADSIGFINVAQLGSVAIGLAIAGSIFQNLGYVKLRHALESYGFSEEELRSALAGTISPVFQRGDPVVLQSAVKAVGETISTSYALVIASGAVIVVGACFMKWEKLKLELTAGG